MGGKHLFFLLVGVFGASPWSAVPPSRFKERKAPPVAQAWPTFRQTSWRACRFMRLPESRLLLGPSKDGHRSCRV
ncbi:hypothetical protein QBC33DRAFT_523828 [Phialemonium atrogriseum]|uniref:Secreted protein n=1 Tax=Phialemonium atrogriseum TaxID=1093897 RepID=A0AAJ0FKV5_9PEZI|nr:uncharacterized protein QBC33DRAFT_523828 [Phialemonium atrogriseum]KAK1771477.1 hypothetical protein QBC33DRAFT_523828 [Phialemonium atrogriseum]